MQKHQLPKNIKKPKAASKEKRSKHKAYKRKEKKSCLHLLNKAEKYSIYKLSKGLCAI